MKRVALSLTVVSVFLVFAACSGQNHMGTSDQAQNKSFTGEIMDSQCAQAGSHDAMMQKGGLNNAKDCTWACVKAGAKFVLYDAANKTIYQLDDQSKAGEFAGQQVKVTGSYNASTQTIHVGTMEGSGGSDSGS